MNRHENPNRFTSLMRWLARLGSLVSVVLLLLFLIGEPPSPGQLTFAEWMGLFFFPFGVMVGMLLGWRRETLGGAVTLLSLLGFYMVMYSERGQFPGGLWFALFALPGLIFLACGLRSKRQSKQLKIV